MSKQTFQLGNEPIKPLFFKMAIPIILGLIVGGLYNIVDAYFVTKGVNEFAMGGVSVVFPIQMAVFAIAGLIGAGTSSIVARLLGAKDLEQAQKTAMSGIWMALILSAVLIPVLLLFGAHFLANNVSDELRPYATDFLYPIIYSTPIIMLLSALNDLVRAEGKMQFLMLSILLSSILNIIFDPIAIYVLDLGVMGVALATILAQSISLALMLYFYLNNKTYVKLNFKIFDFSLERTVNIISLGLPIFFSHFGIALMIFIVNLVLFSNLENSDHIISAYGLNGRLYMFFIFPMIGMTIAYQTICGFNYGANQFDRVKQSTNFAVIVTSIYCTVISVIMLSFAQPIFRLFSDDPMMIQEGIHIVKYSYLGFAVTGATGLFAIYFQAIGKALPAFLLSILKTYLLIIPGLLIVPIVFDVTKIWWVFPISDIITFVISLAFIAIAFKHLSVKSNDQLSFSN
ncbi:MATE family efflux transporter [Marinicellulosiphila megalodicopiae]|uniref:MATE family efflux transporter n=1 Tax=Marinicellulosiphila megalodicopiae TaxID=2724896 RepID=UPI003BAFE5D8